MTVKMQEIILVTFQGEPWRLPEATPGTNPEYPATGGDHRLSCRGMKLFSCKFATVADLGLSRMMACGPFAGSGRAEAGRSERRGEDISLKDCCRSSFR
jgi:hypothetical protein